MGLLSKFFNNARKPAGFLGKMMVNAQAIRESRCKVVEGSVAELPFGKDTFDMVTAFETIYFWPDIEHCFNEVKRVLKDGGVFAIGNEDDGLSGMNEETTATCATSCPRLPSTRHCRPPGKRHWRRWSFSPCTCGVR